MALLADDERMLKNMLMELNDRCEDYGLKININQTKMEGGTERHLPKTDDRCRRVRW